MPWRTILGTPGWALVHRGYGGQRSPAPHPRNDTSALAWPRRGFAGPRHGCPSSRGRRSSQSANGRAGRGGCRFRTRRHADQASDVMSGESAAERMSSVADRFRSLRTAGALMAGTGPAAHGGPTFPALRGPASALPVEPRRHGCRRGSCSPCRCFATPLAATAQPLGASSERPVAAAAEGPAWRSLRRGCLPSGVKNQCDEELPPGCFRADSASR
jgi:hypothetical protein